MGFYADQLLPWFTHVSMGRPMEPYRKKVTEGLSGEVLEIGFGSGRNLRHLPDQVSRVLAVEPAPGAIKLAEKRIAEAPVPVEVVGSDGQDLDLPDQSVDHALTTWTLCTIPDVDRALAEIHRVLRPGGTLHFVEHGRAPSPKVAARQEKLNPVWGRVLGGCHLDRRHDELIERAGFEVDRLDHPTMGPHLFGYMYQGVATKTE